MTGRTSPTILPHPPTKPSAVRRWLRLKAAIPDRADLVLLGDSLAAGWPDGLLAETFPGWRVFNFGLPGDRLSQTMWRLREADLAPLRPRAVVLLAGTNDLGDGRGAEGIAAATETVLSLARWLWPDAFLVLVTIPPRGSPPGLRDGDRLAINRATTAAVARRGGTALDVDALLRARRAWPSAILHMDLLHLNENGYEMLTLGLAEALANADWDRRPA